MEKHNFKKKYGQNFLNSEIVLDKIVDLFEVNNTDKIVEVGPGAGALTKRLINKGCSVISFEIDESLKQFLDKINSNNLNVVYGDFLNVNLNDYFNKEDNLYFVANIPYYITTPIITKFIDDGVIPKVMILMVQKEVGERLSASPGTSDYGAITVILNYYFDVRYEFTVNRSDFYPVPNVDSCIISLCKKDNVVSVKDFNKFKKFVNDSFKQKRKNLRNNLKGYDLDIISNVLNKYGLDLTNRAEDLGYEVFVDIVNSL